MHRLVIGLCRHASIHAVDRKQEQSKDDGLSIFGEERKAKRLHSGENGPTSTWNLLFSPARFTTEISFLPVRVTRFVWNWNDPHCALVREKSLLYSSCQWMNVLVQFNSTRTMSKTALKVIQKQLEPWKPSRRMFFNGSRLFSFSKWIMVKQAQKTVWILVAHRSKCRKKHASVTLSRHLAYFQRPAKKKKKRSSFSMSYKLSKRISASAKNRIFL